MASVKVSSWQYRGWWGGEEEEEEGTGGDQGGVYGVPVLRASCKRVIIKHFCCFVENCFRLKFCVFYIIINTTQANSGQTNKCMNKKQIMLLNFSENVTIYVDIKKHIANIKRLV